MMFSKSIALFFLISLVFVSGDNPDLSSKGEKNETETASSSTTPPPPSTVNEDPSSASTVKPSPVTVTTTNGTTDKPTTAVPTRPTTQPTTTSPSTTTVEPKPTPTPAPAPKSDTWVVKNGSLICIQLKAKLDIAVSVLDETTKKIDVISVNVPINATATGSCGKDSQVLNLTWPVEIPKKSNESDFNVLSFNFTKEGCEYYIKEINATVYYLENNSTKVSSVVLGSAGQRFTTTSNNSYICASPDPISLKAQNSNVTAELKLSSLQYEAFAHASKENEFSSSQDCASEVPDIVPVLVAAALALLVIVVLVAYIITRRRTQAHGYLSM